MCRLRSRCRGSASLGVLVKLLVGFHRSPQKLVIACPPGVILNALKLSQLDRLVEIENTLEAATESLS